MIILQRVSGGKGGIDSEILDLSVQALLGAHLKNGEHIVGRDSKSFLRKGALPGFLGFGETVLGFRNFRQNVLSYFFMNVGTKHFKGVHGSKSFSAGV